MARELRVRDEETLVDGTGLRLRVALPDIIESRLDIERDLHVCLVSRIVVVLELRGDTFLAARGIHIHLMGHAFTRYHLPPFDEPPFLLEYLGHEVLERVPGGAELEECAAEAVAGGCGPRLAA